MNANEDQTAAAEKQQRDNSRESRRRMFVVGAQEDAANKEDTTVAFAATSTRNFLVCLPFFSFTLLVLFLCCLFAFLLLMHKGHKRRCKSLTYVKNMCIICKEYVHNMYTHYRVSVLVTYTINTDHPVRLLTQKMRLIKKLHVITK